MVVRPFPSFANGKRSLKRSIGFPNLEENNTINLLEDLKNIIASQNIGNVSSRNINLEIQRP
jgi:hypothetical protein